VAGPINRATPSAAAISLQALLACLGFAAIGIWSWSCLEDSSAPLGAAQAPFFFVLVFNTYFSIVCFSNTGSSGWEQRIFDVLLGAIYIFLGFEIGRSPDFEATSLALFLVATLKYVSLERRVQSRVIERKIKLDLIGSALCLAGLTSSLSGHSLEGAWVTSTVFFLANIYLLLVKPMYPRDRIT
jgi:hypothetical protein